MKSKDFVLQHFPDAFIDNQLPIIPNGRRIFYVIANDLAIGIGDTESSAWVDAKKFLQQYGTNPEKW